VHSGQPEQSLDRDRRDAGPSTRHDNHPPDSQTPRDLTQAAHITCKICSSRKSSTISASARTLLRVSPAMTKPIPTIDKYMTTSPMTVSQDDSLAHAQKLMSDNKFRHLPVLDGEKLVGMISDRDVALISSIAGADPHVLKVVDAMTPKPFTTSPKTLIDEVVSTMAEHKIGSVVVMDNNHVVGIFTAVDALGAFAHLLQTRLGK
jgi:acetoin utilization protein AcuB